ncbi:MAG: efflux RND transporter periplasmic adaptor subunit [Deltaproteobacteria bacterium]|nr:efflux RND transporter periplasmic adaptor subunit [Deltaproteobacteria bacterium]
MMKKNKRKTFLTIFLALILLGVVVWVMIPSPLEVDLQSSQKGMLMVTVDEEGETRAKDRFVVSSPVSGRLTRIQLKEGDPVGLNQTVAVIHPLPLGKRESTEIRARLQAAQALHREAEILIRQTQLNLEKFRRERQRTEQLHKNGLITHQELELARDAEKLRIEEFDAAKMKAQAAAFEIKAIRSGLISLEEGKGEPKIISVRSPVAGRVLKVMEKNEQVVVPGTPLLVLGNPSQLEVVIDLLTTEAVKVKTGNTVLLENWGGDQPLQARVRLVEPWGFTKVSALGVEEKRVNVIADFVDPSTSLGDGFRVEARIIIWKGEGILKIPASALFRVGQSRAVFVHQDGRAKRREVEVGRQGAFEVEIQKGLKEGEEVVIHPSNQIREGLRIVKR